MDRCELALETPKLWILCRSIIENWQRVCSKYLDEINKKILKSKHIQFIKRTK